MWRPRIDRFKDNVFGVAKGLWKSEGVLAPEALPSKPFLERIEKYGFPPFVTDYDSEYKLAADKEAVLKNMKMQRWGMHETMDKTEKQQGGDLFQKRWISMVIRYQRKTCLEFFAKRKTDFVA